MWGIPRNYLIRGLLWHAVYKPFWNEEAKHSPSAPTWSWSSLSQRVGWPNYSSGKVDSDAVHVKDVKIVDLLGDGEVLAGSWDPKRVKFALLSLSMGLWLLLASSSLIKLRGKGHLPDGLLRRRWPAQWIVISRSEMYMC